MTLLLLFRPKNNASLTPTATVGETNVALLRADVNVKLVRADTNTPILRADTNVRIAG